LYTVSHFSKCLEALTFGLEQRSVVSFANKRAASSVLMSEAN
jgi:hypothetical protein